jgi:hypothetical protein
LLLAWPVLQVVCTAGHLMRSGVVFFTCFVKLQSCCCPSLLLLALPAEQVVYTAGHLMRVTVVATKHQQLMQTRATQLQSSVTNVSQQQQQQRQMFLYSKSFDSQEQLIAAAAGVCLSVRCCCVLQHLLYA